eukprot:TRINITY_DN14966_c0_g1_i5.p1 TRINITY_DN14966_c0_g1~~TRINITY_DN14966_c0_g1_i5.p1  ORF type:complete len:736 (-),score=121.46 TRINITY_DN14966_c0_g1_i5:22-1926(-)
MALSLPNKSPPAQEAHLRYYSQGLETRPFLDWLNKPQTPDPCVMTLKGHEMVVRSCCYWESHEEKTNPRIVACSDDSTLKLYDGKTGEELTTFKGGKGSVLFCDFSSNGKFVVSGGYGRSVVVWNAENGRILNSMRGHKAVITCCRFHPKNVDLVLSTSKDKTFRIWNRGMLLKEVVHTRSILSCAFNPDGTLVAVSSEDTAIRLYETEQWTEVRSLSQFNGHSRSVNSVNFSHDGNLLISSSDDRSVLIWDLFSYCVKQKLVGHKDGTTWAVLNRDSTRAISSSHDNVIYLWDVSKGQMLSCFIGHTGSVYRCQFSMDEKFIISCSFDRTAKIWEVNENIEYIGHESRILTVAFSPDGKYLATGSRDKTLKIWDTLEMKELMHLHGHTSNVFHVCWSPDSKFVCSAGRDKVLKIWDILSKSCIKTLSGHKEPVRSCAWSPDGQHILSTSEDKTAIIWDVHNLFKPLGTLYGHRASIVTCAFSSDGLRVATGSEDCSIKLWDTKKGSINYGSTYNKVGTFLAHKKVINTLCFNPGGRFQLVSGGDDNVLILWNALTAKIEAVFEGHTEQIRGVCFTTDGRYIISGSTDSTVRMWNTKTRQVDVSFACLSRLCAIDSCTKDFKHRIACGDGSGAL